MVERLPDNPFLVSLMSALTAGTFLAAAGAAGITGTTIFFVAGLSEGSESICKSMPLTSMLGSGIGAGARLECFAGLATIGSGADAKSMSISMASAADSLTGGAFIDGFGATFGLSETSRI